MSVVAPPEGWCPHIGEILDQPLYWNVSLVLLPASLQLCSVPVKCRLTSYLILAIFCKFPVIFTVFFFKPRKLGDIYGISGGSRISPKRGLQLPGGGGANIRFCQNFPKTAWNWKNLDPGGGAPVHPLRSATGDTCLCNGGGGVVNKWTRSFSMVQRHWNVFVLAGFQHYFHNVLLYYLATNHCSPKADSCFDAHSVNGRYRIGTVPEDTVPTNVYTSSYLRHHTVKYGNHSLSDSCSKQNNRTDVGDKQSSTLDSVVTSCT